MFKGNIVITGVSSGIGYYCAQRFIDEGYRVFGSVRKDSDANRLSSQWGTAYEPVIFDVTDAGQIRAEARRVGEKVALEGVRCLINNSGIVVHGVVELTDVDEFRRQFEVNFFGLIEVSKAFLPWLGTLPDAPFEPGKIINISSIAGRNSLPFLTPYAASKAAVDRFSQGLRRELMMFGIDVVVLNPGPVQTPIWDKVEEPSSDVMDTAYGKPLRTFIKFFHKISEGESIKVEDFADKVYRVFKSDSPKTSQVVMRKKLIRYYLPKWTMSTRTYERLIQKVLKLKL